jgi:hypothetical protein
MPRSLFAVPPAFLLKFFPSFHEGNSRPSQDLSYPGNCGYGLQTAQAPPILEAEGHKAAEVPETQAGVPARTRQMSGGGEPPGGSPCEAPTGAMGADAPRAQAKPAEESVMKWTRNRETRAEFPTSLAPVVGRAGRKLEG